MSKKYALMGLVALGLVLLAVFEFTMVPAQPFKIAVQFTGYIQSGLPEQDVFVEPGEILDELHPSNVPTLEPCPPLVQQAVRYLGPCYSRVDVVRPVPPDAANQPFLAKRVYANSNPVPHDPYRKMKNALGPFHKGDSLDFTWGDWLSARGGGYFTVTNGVGELDLNFTRLVPNGNYDLICRAEISPLNNSTIDVPCGANDEHLTTFRADRAGMAHIYARMKTSPGTNRQATTILSVEYSRSGTTQKQDTEGYGFTRHVQLWFPFP